MPSTGKPGCWLFSEGSALRFLHAPCQDLLNAWLAINMYKNCLKNSSSSPQIRLGHEGEIFIDLFQLEEYSVKCSE
eukprot:5151461-Amphidinium_carterae.1